MINDMFVALNSSDISTFNQFYFFKVTGYYSILRFPATVAFTRDAGFNPHCLKLQYRDLTAQRLPYTPPHRIFHNATPSVWNIWGRCQWQNTTQP